MSAMLPKAEEKLEYQQIHDGCDPRSKTGASLGITRDELSDYERTAIRPMLIHFARKRYVFADATPIARCRSPMARR